MIMEKKYKFINIGQVNSEVFFGKHPVYRIFDNSSRNQLGLISFYGPWKQYVFSSRPECVFNDSCLRDILNFMGEIDHARLAGKDKD